MKRLLTAVWAGAAIFLISCGTINYSNKSPRMVADVDPFSVGTVEAVFDRFLSTNLNKIEIEAIFYPRLNAVALEFRYEFITHRQFWDEAARKQFVVALEQYKKDYEARTLIDRHRKTRDVYGKVQGRTEWQSFRFSQNHLAFPAFELGYRFRNGTPFFTTFMRSVREEKDPLDDSEQGYSVPLTMYFTRAYADELAKLFDQTYLIGLLGNRGGPQSEQTDGSFEVDY
jgi:hypothetical protein